MQLAAYDPQLRLARSAAVVDAADGGPCGVSDVWQNHGVRTRMTITTVWGLGLGPKAGDQQAHLSLNQFVAGESACVSSTR